MELQSHFCFSPVLEMFSAKETSVERFPFLTRNMSIRCSVEVFTSSPAEHSVLFIFCIHRVVCPQSSVFCISVLMRATDLLFVIMWSRTVEMINVSQLFSHGRWWAVLDIFDRTYDVFLQSDLRRHILQNIIELLQVRVAFHIFCPYCVIAGRIYRLKVGIVKMIATGKQESCHQLTPIISCIGVEVLFSWMQYGVEFFVYRLKLWHKFAYTFAFVLLVRFTRRSQFLSKYLHMFTKSYMLMILLKLETTGIDDDNTAVTLFGCSWMSRPVDFVILQLLFYICEAT